MNDFHFEVVEELGVLSSSQSGWSRELNRVSWNGAPAKLDIRDWSPDHSKMGKGISLNEAEVAKLKELLAKI
ncbi:YdbC family protein [bacterium]|nr:YdbC family protein [bacterium]